MNNIENYIIKYKFLEHNDCDELIRLYAHRDFQTHGWSDGKNSYSEKDKELDVLALDNNHSSLLVKKVEPFIIDYQNKFKKTEKAVTLVNNLSSFRLNKYLPNTYMREHFDHIHDLFDGEKKGVPILSLLVLLNDEFEGGQFTINGEDQNLQKGELIIFPSCFLYPHKVELITKGTRYSIIAWGF